MKNDYSNYIDVAAQIQRAQALRGKMLAEGFAIIWGGVKNGFAWLAARSSGVKRTRMTPRALSVTTFHMFDA
jgi:hypothetical protein